MNSFQLPILSCVTDFRNLEQHGAHSARFFIQISNLPDHGNLIADHNRFEETILTTTIQDVCKRLGGR
ncbi:uncharacterized protein METZ01_LOCUS377541, partial [marine metagenome]